jgi:hypothetical protein
MTKNTNSLLFPPRAIPFLREERGEAWLDLVVSVEKSGTDSPERAAFILMMARLSACATCNAHSYRAVQGCITCAKQAIGRFHGSDDELVKIFDAAKIEVQEFLLQSR